MCILATENDFFLVFIDSCYIFMYFFIILWGNSYQDLADLSISFLFLNNMQLVSSFDLVSRDLRVKTLLYLIYVYICGPVWWVYVYHMHTGALGSQKRPLAGLELELRMFVSCLMWALGTKSWPSTRAVKSTLDC